MIDTISIDINVGKRLQKGDFKNIKYMKTKEQPLNNNEPKFQTDILLDWSKDIKAAKGYLPEVRYLDFPNPNPKVKGRCYVYRITASIPKLLYDNNVLEVSEKQFDKIVELLYSEMVFLGLPTDISEEDIRNAKVARVDFGKNVILPSSANMRKIGEALTRSEHRFGSKYAQVQYRNGDLYRENIKNRSVVVYDKLTEFSANLKRPHSNFESLLVSAKKINLFQIVRVEVQIQTTAQLKKELKSLGLNPENVTFVDIFKESLARQLLFKHWDNIIKNVKIESESNSLNIFINAAKKQKCGAQKSYAKVGFNTLIKEVGLDMVKRTFYKCYAPNNWSKYRDDLSETPNTIDEGSVIGSVIEAIEEITKSIEEMNPIGMWEEGEYVEF